MKGSASLSGARAAVAACALLAACAPAPVVVRGGPSPTQSIPPASSISPASSIPSPMPARPGSPTLLPSGAPVEVRAATVTGVVDGDTIDVLLGARTERVRLIGVDTPERGQRWSREATALTRARLDGRRVWLEYDVERRDRFGRLLAYVWRTRPDSRARSDVRSGMHNATPLLRGLAVLLTIPPNVSYVEQLQAFQRKARARDRGLWSAESSGECDRSYPDVCIPPPPPDLDCGDIEHRNFRVTGSDPHRFDADGNGRGCEGA